MTDQGGTEKGAPKILISDVFDLLLFSLCNYKI